MGGGGFDPLLDEHILSLARAASGRDRPRVCFLSTASGESPTYVASFYDAFARRSEASHLSLFDRTVDDIDAFLGEQDVVYVGGGNTENMLAIWRVHGVDRALRRAWEGGTVMTGQSAGSLCWFETGTTDSFGKGLAALSGGLGFVPGSHAPHYDSETTRRPHYERLVAEGVLPAGYAADDGAALVFHGGELAEVVAARPDARAYRVERGPDGTAIETVAGDALPGLIRLDRLPAAGRARPTSRRLGRRPVPRRSRAGAGRSRRSRPSRAARDPERYRPAARARTGGPPPPGGAPRAAWRPSPDRARRRRTGRRPDARPRSATARRRGGRGRARGGPSGDDAGARRRARAP